MKAIWTVLFLACMAAALGIALVLVPEHARGDRFWLSVGGVLLALLLTYITLVLLPRTGGEQGQDVLRFQTSTGSMIYLCAALALAGLSATGIGFRWLAALHILALLMWVLLAGIGALGSQAMRRADELKR